MKQVALLLTALAIIQFTNAQTALILNELNVPATPDSITYYQASSAGIQAATVGTNQVWDYSNLQDTLSAMGYNISNSASAHFPTANLSQRQFEEIAIGRGIYYYNMIKIDSSGYLVLGYDVPEQHYSLQGVPLAQPTDSFNVYEQQVTYPSPRTVLDFPASIGSSWWSSAVKTYEATVTFAALSFNDMLVTKKVYETSYDTIAGWGRMRIPNDMGPSLYYNVLLCQRTTIQVDSFFLDNVAADNTTLSLFQLTQGDTNTIYRTLFYREGTLYPLVNYYSSDSTFSDVTTIYYDAETDVATGMISVTAPQLHAKVFPNPSSGRNQHILFTAEKTGQVHLNIYDMTGKRVNTSPLQVTAGENQYTLPAGMNDGVYLLSITNAQNEVLYRNKIVK